MVTKQIFVAPQAEACTFQLPVNAEEIEPDAAMAVISISN